jgi:hypothetical protein
VPGLPIRSDRNHGEGPERRQLLAMHELWRGVERPAAAVATGQSRLAMTRSRLARELEELISALDRRVPHVERAGEASIARDAAALRTKAIKRLAELDGKEQVPSRRPASGPKRVR